MEGHQVGVMLVVGAAETIVKRCPRDGDEIVAFELPIHILKAMSGDLRMVQDNRPDGPATQIGGVD